MSSIQCTKDFHDNTPNFIYLFIKGLSSPKKTIRAQIKKTKKTLLSEILAVQTDTITINKKTLVSPTGY